MSEVFSLPRPLLCLPFGRRKQVFLRAFCVCAHTSLTTRLFLLHLAYNHSRCHNRPGSAIHRHVVWPRCGPPATTVSGPGLSCKVIRQLVNLSLGDKFRPLVSIRASTFSSSKRCLGSHSLSYALIGWHRLQVGVGGRG